MQQQAHGSQRKNGSISVIVTGALLRADRVAGCEPDQASPLVGKVVDRDETVEADADAAEDPSGAPGAKPAVE